MASIASKGEPTELEALRAKNQRNLNCLSDPNRSTRRRALKKFVKEFDADSEKTPKKKKIRRLHAAFFKSELQHRLIPLLSDEIEKCRELALTLLKHFALYVLRDSSATTVSKEDGEDKSHPEAVTSDDKEPPLASLFFALVPIAESRIGSTPFAEPTEEIRLLIVDLIGSLLEKTSVVSSPKLEGIGSTLLQILSRACQDPFPDVKKSCAKAIMLLCRVAPSQLHTCLEKSAVDLIGNLGHQHSRVRSITLDALAALLPNGSESLERVMVEKVIPAFKSISADRSGSVRRAVVSTAAKLCTSLPLPERFQADLLPLVLGGIADEADDVKEFSADMMCKIGGVVKDEALGADQGALSAPITQDIRIAAAAAGATLDGATDTKESKNAEGEAEVSQSAKVEALLPTLGPPFDKIVPNKYSKVLVKRLLPQLLPPVLKELHEWTVSRRSHAAGVLSAILVFAEGSAVSFLPKIINALGNACRDDDESIARRSFACAELLGIFLPLETVLLQLLPRIGETGPSSNGKIISGQERAGLLMILSAVMGATQQQLSLADTFEIDDNSSDRRSIADLMHDVVDTLSTPVVCESEATEVQAQLVEVLLDVIQVGCADVDAASSRSTKATFKLLELSSDTNLKFVRIILQLQATPGSEDDAHVANVRTGASAALKALSEACGVGADNTSKIFERHFGKLLGMTLINRSESPDDAQAAAADVNIVKSARNAGRWVKDTPQRRMFDTLIRLSVASTSAPDGKMAHAGDETNPVAEYLHLVLPVFEAALQTSCDPDLRMGMLALLATVLEDPAIGRTCREREGYGGTMLQRLLIPNCIWRVGRVASSVRKIAMRCVSILLRERLVAQDSLFAICHGEEKQFVPTLQSCLDDDEPMTRQLACLALMGVFEILPGKLGMETSMVSRHFCLVQMCSKKVYSGFVSA